ncbi:Arrestin domain-containing protein 15 [Toxocara canis]|uniref:Arrestin domain-containing protein 15 n=1 Tax=Toxocara canis TaxID=6265 RepID=A0A0B2UXR0_TOXCA|nr:Arrestin domain-containing protein 15 [Toxocara canis]
MSSATVPQPGATRRRSLAQRVAYNVRRRMTSIWTLMPTVAINVVLHEPRIMAGDELFAKVLLESADSDTIVDEFYADIEGVGRTGWVNVHTDKIYEAEREYLQKHIPLMPSGSSLPAGRHQFPLRVFIPETAPSSNESQFGNTRYTIKVVLKTNSEQSTCTEVFPFVVVARLFFDDIPQNIMQNIEFKDEVDFTCCSLPFGTVSIKISLPRTGYRIGEMLSCTVIIYNRTRKALKDCCVHVVLKTQFEAMSRYEHVNEKKLSERVVETAVLGNVKSRTDVQFDNCLLKIPESTPPTQCYNKHSPDPNIIALTYVLRFVALPGIEMEIPLVITAKGYRDGHTPYFDQPSEFSKCSKGVNLLMTTLNSGQYSFASRCGEETRIRQPIIN